MAAHPPPVPPDQRSDRGPDRGSAAKTKGETAGKKPLDEKTGQSGAIKQNTTNTGYQQDR